MADVVEWVEHDGLRFRCCVNRAGDGAPWIVFSNSLLTDVSVWDAQAALLAGQYNVLRYDQRGHGETSVPTQPCNFTQLGGDLLALLDHFKIEKTTLVGLSMGVPTALYVMQQQSHRVERLVLSDGQSATAPGGADAWQLRIDAARSTDMTRVGQDTASRWFSADFNAAGLDRKIRVVAEATALEGFVACAQALQNYNFTKVLQNIAIPALVLVGANDGNMPNSMAILAKAIPNAQMHIIPDAGHLPCFEQPAAFNRHLASFLGL